MTPEQTAQQALAAVLNGRDALHLDHIEVLKLLAELGWLRPPVSGDVTREEYALRKPGGEVLYSAFGEFVHGDAAREHMEWMRDQNAKHNLTVVHRTVTETDWEASDD